MKKKNSSVLLSVLAVFFLLTMAFTSSTEAAFPEKAIRMIVGFAPGGNTDIAARSIQNKMSESLGQRVIIENRGGAGSTIATEYVSRSAPDGYTILMVSAAHVINPAMWKNLPYNPIEAFSGISVVTKVPGVLVAHPSVPYRTMPELIAYAKANPGKINFASSGHGTIGHLAGELVMAKADIDMVHIPFKGNAPAMIDLLGGHVDFMFSSLPSAMGHIRAGKLIPIVLSGYERAPVLPDVGTVAEAGLSGCEVVTGFSLFAPVGTPKEVIDILNASVVEAVFDPKVKANIENMGAVPTASSPAETDEFVRSEIAKYKAVVKQAGIEKK